MGFWEKSVRIFHSLCEAGTQSVRHIAQHTSMHRAAENAPLFLARLYPFIAICVTIDRQ
jgi:hypothetical protein